MSEQAITIDRLRAVVRSDGPTGLAAVFAELEDDSTNGVASAEPPELTAYRLVAGGFWATAADLLDQLRDADQLSSEGELTAQWLSSQALSPYDQDALLLDDVRAWAVARLFEIHRDELTREEELRGVVVEERHQDRVAAVELERRFVRRLASTEGLRVQQFAELLHLRSRDLMWLLALLAVEGDIGFHRLRRRWFNDDAFFSVGLMVSLLGRDEFVRSALLSRLDTRAPLIRHRLVYLNTPVGRAGTALANRLVELDESVIAYVAERDFWPAGIDNLVRLHAPEDRPGQRYFAEKLDILNRALTQPRPDGEDGEVRFVALGGATLDTTRALALSFADRAGRPLLEVSAHWLFGDPQGFERVIRLVFREALLRDSLVFIDGNRAWDGEGAGRIEVLRAILRSADVFGQPVLFDASTEGDPVLRRQLAPLFEVRVLPPTLEEQVVIWREALEHAEVEPLDDHTLETQVCDMALNVEDVHRAVRMAVDNAWLLSSSDERPGIDAPTLKSMATSKLNQGMYAVAERVNTSLTWSDVILPETVLSQLMEIITYARYQRQVFEDWGFGSKIPYGRANSSLFTGPPGTGKTMVAGIMAKELGLDLFRVELSSVVSKYVGETEKNLGKVFDEAARSHALILFDEADSLFSKRTEVKSSHDRYSNLEVNYLLQRIESFAGITILTTNFADNIDEAFARRIKFTVEFPFPEPEDRARLWKSMLPPGAEQADQIRFDRLGKAFELSGGSIKNAVLRSAFRAAENSAPIDTALLEQAGIDECRAMGKLVRTDDKGRIVLAEDERKEEIEIV